MSAGTRFRVRFGALAGTRRGRVLAAVLLVSALLMLWLWLVAIGYSNAGYLAFQHGVVLAAFPATAAALLFVAGWLITRKRPASIIIRTIAGVLALLLCAYGTLGGFVLEGLRSEILKTDVLAVSPDGRFEVVRLHTKDLKGAEHDDLRLRSRAGLLSRESPTEFAWCTTGPADADRVRADFVDTLTVRVVGTNDVPVSVTFDAETMRPDRYVDLCPVSSD